MNRTKQRVLSRDRPDISILCKLWLRPSLARSRWQHWCCGGRPRWDNGRCHEPNIEIQQYSRHGISMIPPPPKIITNNTSFFVLNDKNKQFSFQIEFAYFLGLLHSAHITKTFKFLLNICTRKKVSWCLTETISLKLLLVSNITTNWRCCSP